MWDPRGVWYVPELAADSGVLTPADPHRLIDRAVRASSARNRQSRRLLLFPLDLVLIQAQGDFTYDDQWLIRSEAGGIPSVNPMRIRHHYDGGHLQYVRIKLDRLIEKMSVLRLRVKRRR